MSKVSTDINLTNSDLSAGAGNFDSSTDPAVTSSNGKTNGFLVAGTFDGATVKLQQKIGTDWVDVGSRTTLTTDGGGLFTTPVSNLRVNVSGAGSNFDVTVVIKPIQL